jgi:hypothetical protein
MLTKVRGWGDKRNKGQPDLLFLLKINTHTLFKVNMYSVHLNTLRTIHEYKCIADIENS